MEYVVAIINSLAWPVCVIVVFLLLRKQINALLGNLEYMKYKDLEAIFRTKYQEIEAKAKDAGIIIPNDGILADNAFPVESANQINRISDYSPRAAIIETWVMLESILLKIADNIDMPLGNRKCTNSLIQALAKEKAIDKSIVVILDELREIRNKVVHTPDYVLGPADAQRFLFWAGTVYDKLSKKIKKSP